MEKGTSVQTAQVLLRRPRKAGDEPRVGRPSTSETDDNVGRVRSLVSSDRRLTLRMISSELRLNWLTVHHILTRHFGMRKRSVSHGSFYQRIFGDLPKGF
jgi:hypothetical protein